MSDIKDLIRETNRNSRRARLINNILWGIVTCLVGVAFYTSFLAFESKKDAEAERDAKEHLLVEKEGLLIEKEASLKLADSLRLVAETAQGDLELEKEKLEAIKVKYDSIRELTLNQKDDLWEYAVRENTIEAYSDYVKIKGATEQVGDKIKSLLTRTGYMQIQESNSNMLIEPVNRQLGLWTTKSARSVRNGVLNNANYRNQSRTGDVILNSQPFVILEDSIMTGKARWAKIAY